MNLPWIMLDQFVSEASATRRYAVLNLVKDWRGWEIRAALMSPNGFILFLRDFDPSDSEAFEYTPIVGARTTYYHRDTYAFVGVDAFALPVIAVNNPGDGRKSNESFSYLFLDGRSWQRVVRQLLAKAAGIIVVVPSDGHLLNFATSRDFTGAWHCQERAAAVARAGSRRGDPASGAGNDFHRQLQSGPRTCGPHGPQRRQG